MTTTEKDDIETTTTGQAMPEVVKEVWDILEAEQEDDDESLLSKIGRRANSIQPVANVEWKAENTKILLNLEQRLLPINRRYIAFRTFKEDACQLYSSLRIRPAWDALCKYDEKWNNLETCLNTIRENIRHLQHAELITNVDYFVAEFVKQQTDTDLRYRQLRRHVDNVRFDVRKSALTRLNALWAEVESAMTNTPWMGTLKVEKMVS